MGIESFYITVQTKSAASQNILQKYNTFIAFACDEQDGTVCMTGALVSFLPACEAMYRVCCAIAADTGIFSVQSCGKAGSFQFDNSEMPEFLAWMYRCWQEKLAYFHAEWGAFTVLPSVYYETRRKLRNYYQILPQREDSYADD